MSVLPPRLRVLYLAVYDPHIPLTGTGTRGQQFVGKLSGYFDVDLLYVAGSGHAVDPQVEARYAGCLTDLRSCTRMPFHKLGYFLYSPEFHARAAAMCRAHAYDWIVCDYGLSGLYGLRLAKRFNVPWAYLSHNLEHRAYLIKSLRDPRRLPLVPFVYHVERRSVQKCDLLVSITPDEADFYSHWTGKTKQMVIPQCVDPMVFNPFYPPPRNQPRVVLFCGNFNNPLNRKALRETAERIIDPVVARFPGVRFRFIGANPPADVSHPNLETPGFVDDYPAALKSADVVISPMRGGTGFPTKIVEALACGKPTIATENGARAIPREFRCLSVEPIERFAPAINEALERDHPVDNTQFNELYRAFSWTHHLHQLAWRMAELTRHA